MTLTCVSTRGSVPGILPEFGQPLSVLVLVSTKRTASPKDSVISGTWTNIILNTGIGLARMNELIGGVTITPLCVC